MHTAGFGHAKATATTTTVAAATTTTARTTTARAICNYIKIRQKRWKKNERKKIAYFAKAVVCVCVCAYV